MGMGECLLRYDCPSAFSFRQSLASYGLRHQPSFLRYWSGTVNVPFFVMLLVLHISNVEYASVAKKCSGFRHCFSRRTLVERV